MNKVEEAVSCFNDGEGFSCSQSICSTYAEQFGLNQEMALRITTAFGGGMGKMGETCGAVTGAFMVIGLKYGRIRVEDKKIKEKANDLVREFVKHFKSRNGSTLCRDLLGCNISTPEGHSAAKANNLFATVCPKLVRDAAEILEELLSKK